MEPIPGDLPRALLRDLELRVAPVTEAGQRLAPVPAELASLFPAGGLQQGWSVGVGGVGGWSLALALLGPALGRDGWAACVGAEELGLVSGGELGLPLDRLLLVESPGSVHGASVVAALVEAVDVVCLGPGLAFSAREARRLAARAREQGAVLIHLDGGRSWPQPLDVALTVEPGPWVGIGAGHGHLQARPVTITATGRRSMARPRRVEVLLPGPNGALVSPADRDSGREVDVEQSVERDVEQSVERDVEQSVERDVEQSVERDVEQSVERDVEQSVVEQSVVGG